MWANATRPRPPAAYKTNKAEFDGAAKTGCGGNLEWIVFPPILFTSASSIFFHPLVARNQTVFGKQPRALNRPAQTNNVGQIQWHRRTPKHRKEPDTCGRFQTKRR
jgi:hypothetical protein